MARNVCAVLIFVFCVTSRVACVVCGVCCLTGVASRVVSCLLWVLLGVVCGLLVWCVLCERCGGVVCSMWCVM